ncbi:toll/interleukin-1 receptor domain-containing protein [Micromonospora sp. L31]|uniref:toll/interleukin-1 receptor domain-containing protein n=1 Tax=Micromonospora sp. L31 TaxID=3452213 RepID=UPI003F8A9125
MEAEATIAEQLQTADPVPSAPITPSVWLQRILIEADCSKAALARMIGRSREEVTRWASGREQIPRGHLGEIASNLAGPREIDYVLRLKDCEDYTDRLKREADRFAKLAQVAPDVVTGAMLRSMDAAMKSVHLDGTSQALDWIDNLSAATFVLRIWSGFLRDGAVNNNLIDCENVPRHLQYPVNLFFGTLLDLPGPGREISISRAVGLAELRRLVNGAAEAEAVPLIRQHALHLLGRYGDEADRAMVSEIVSGNIRSADALSRKLGYCGLMMASENGREVADRFVYHLSRDKELADIDLAFDATHYRDLRLGHDRSLQRPAPGMVNLATNIAKHYENPARYAPLADADAFRMMKIIELGGLAPLGSEVAQMFRACLDAGLIPREGGTFTRLLRSTLAAELAELPPAGGLSQEEPSAPAPATGTKRPATARVDAFLAYHSSDVNMVRRIATELKKLNARCWFDRDDLLPGQLVQDALEAALQNCRSTVVFIGAEGLGPWERFEYRHAVSTAVYNGQAIIPVLLNGPRFPADAPAFIRQFYAVHVDDGSTPAAIARKIHAGIKAAVGL